MPARKKKPVPVKYGQTGQVIYDAVEKVVKEKGVSRLQAFKEVAKQTGRQVGTVQANYYRIARKVGTVTPRKRSGKRTAKRRGRPPGSGRRGRAARGGSAAAAARRAEQAIKELADLLVKQERELQTLRDENARFAEIRKLVR